MKFSIKYSVFIFLSVGLFLNLCAAAPVKSFSDPAEARPGKYAPDSLEGIAFLRAKDFPDPDVVLPPFDIKKAGWNDRVQYSRVHCTTYVKAYEEMYLKQFHITRAYSPFLGFCERRVTKLSSDDGSGILTSRSTFKTRLDRVSLNFELSGGLANAQTQLAQSAQIQKLSDDVSDSAKKMDTLLSQVTSLTTKQTQIEAKMRSQKEDASMGFLAMLHLNPGTENKIIEFLLLVSLVLCAFFIYRKKQY